MGQYEDAIKCYDKVIELEPKNATFWYEKGNTLQKLRKYDEAIKCYDKVIELDPHQVYAWASMGDCQYMSEKFDKAIYCYDEAIELEPKNAIFWYIKGGILYRKTLNRKLAYFIPVFIAVPIFSVLLGHLKLDATTPLVLFFPTFSVFSYFLLSQFIPFDNIIVHLPNSVTFIGISFISIMPLVIGYGSFIGPFSTALVFMIILYIAYWGDASTCFNKAMELGLKKVDDLLLKKAHPGEIDKGELMSEIKWHIREEQRRERRHRDK